MRKNGFTLIELLVAISIIAVLSAVGFTTYQGIQAKARDSIRKTDLQKLATALELYAQQHNLTYMDGTAGVEGDCTSADTTTFYHPTNGIAPYMSDNNVPTDPSTHNNYCYISLNNGQAFRLFAKLENCSDSQIIPNINCASASYNYSITSDNLALAPVPTPVPTAPPSCPGLPSYAAYNPNQFPTAPAVIYINCSRPYFYSYGDNLNVFSDVDPSPDNFHYWTTQNGTASEGNILLFGQPLLTTPPFRRINVDLRWP